MLRAGGIYAASHFTLKDYGTAFADRGLLNSDGTIGAQGTVWQTWHQTVGAMTYAGKDTLPSNIQCHRFTAGTTTVRVVWASLDAPIISVTGGTYTAKNASGTTITASGTHTLGLSPIYLTSTSNLTIALATTVPPQDMLRAYPEIDFSLDQGQAGWTYKSFSGGLYANAAPDTDQQRVDEHEFERLAAGSDHRAPRGVRRAAARPDRCGPQVDGALTGHHQGQGDRHLRAGVQAATAPT